MNNIEQAFQNYIQSGKDYLLAVSGGADSMVMLYAAKKIAEQKDAHIRVITIEHGIRGEESKSDAKFVQAECQKLGVECKCISIQTKKYATENKLTIEESARKLRYQIFKQETKQNETLLIAHNKDDQAETVLMHIFRGSGIDGATGIKNRDNIKRPLLGITKQEILDYAKQNKIQYVTDSTNEQIEYSRNFVRKEILPKIEQIYPNVTENIVKFADFCSKAQQLVDQSINEDWFTQTENSIILDGQAFEQNDLIMAKAIKICYNKLGEYADLESKHISIIKEFYTMSKSGATLNLPHNVIVEKRKNKVIFYKNADVKNNDTKFQLGENILPNGKKVIATLVSNSDVVFGDGQFYADYDKISLDSVWRTKQQGDKFSKLGSNGSKKLSDYYTDKKLSLVDRQNQIILAIKNQVLFVVGKDISNSIKIDDQTERIVCFKEE